MKDKALEGVFRRHIERLKGSLSAHSHDTVSEFITTHTKILGKPFSYIDHEYQEQIVRDKSRVKYIMKCAQVGISEIMARYALAKGALVNGFTTIYTLPAATAAQNFMTTRVSPIIEASPYLRELVNPNVDNSMIKRFGDSYLYLKGAQVDRQAISVPADLLVNDEVDNSNKDVLTLYQSRLRHSRYKENVQLSTPTIPGYGIDLLFKQSRRHFNLCKCHHCNNWFYPDYFKHTRIPGFDGKMDSITKSHFQSPKFHYMKAYIACPKCEKRVDLGPDHRQWVVENSDDAFEAAGYAVSPFDCPRIIELSDLIKESVKYERVQDFHNQALGRPMEDKETTLTREELDKLIISDYVGGGYSFVMGLDMGMTCWATIGAVFPDGEMVVVHTEGIPLFNVRQRRKELAAEYRVRMTVVDSLPYTETVYQMQQEDDNLFAAIYDNSKALDLFKVKDQEEDDEKAKLKVKSVNISRDKMFDLVMLQLRSGKILKKSDANDEMWKDHLTDMKRTREFRNDELVFVWVKTQGNDHLHHSLLYCLTASKMLGVASVIMAGLSPVLGSFRRKSN